MVLDRGYKYELLQDEESINNFTTNNMAKEELVNKYLCKKKQKQNVIYQIFAKQNWLKIKFLLCLNLILFYLNYILLTTLLTTLTISLLNVIII